MTDPKWQLRQFILGVPDVGKAISFYSEQLGIPIRFRDGSRFAAMDLGGVVLALAGPDQHPEGIAVALGIKVVDLDATLDELRAGGWTVLEDPQLGTHERRVTVRDPNGTPMVLYEPLASDSSR